MPAYNAENKIIRAIECVINQTYKNWELIIINDGSQDLTKNIVKRYCEKEEKIKLISREKNKGIAFSRNEGIVASKGAYIAFLDSDDCWKPDKLEIQLTVMVQKNIEFSCTAYTVVDEKNNLIRSMNKKEGTYGYNDLLKTNFIGCLTVMIKSSVMKEFLMPEINHEDYATWLNILSNNNSVFYLNRSLSMYTKAKKSTSSNKFQTFFWTREIIFNQKNKSILKKKILFLRYVYYTVIKYLEK